MYQIKTMRDDGLEIKAIRKILENENIISSSGYMEENNDVLTIVPVETKSDMNLAGMEAFFHDFREQLTSELSTEIKSSKDHLSSEILKTKLELGACVENGMRKMEAKMDKHFQDVDCALGNWRNRKKNKFFNFLNRT
jgi:DNA-binding transcriptional MerR regulator